MKIGNIERRALIFLDDGSLVSLIDKELANSLKAVTRDGTMALVGLNETSLQANIRAVTDFQISGLRASKFHRVKNVYVVPNLKLPIQSFQPRDIAKLRFRAKADLDFFDYDEPKILLGQDQANLIVAREVFEYGNFCLSQTLLGWVAHGSFGQSGFRKCRVYALIEKPREENLLE